MKTMLTITAVVTGMIAFVAALLAIWTNQHSQWFFTALLFGATAAYSALGARYKT